MRQHPPTVDPRSLANCTSRKVTALATGPLGETPDSLAAWEDVAALSPYVREHIIRFGRSALDRERMPPPIDYAAPVTSAAP